MSMVGVPANLVDARHDLYELGEKGFAFHGPPGRGKSWLAAGIVRRQLWEIARSAPPEVREWWLSCGGVRFVRVEALLQHLRHDAFTGTDTDEAAALQRWSDVRLLVLDDLGAEKRSEWTAQTLHSLLSHREALTLPTVVTTNYEPEELEEMYAGWGGPIVSRLHSLCEWVLIKGKDRRRT
jgi:DNA replication protein DnaC